MIIPSNDDNLHLYIVGFGYTSSRFRVLDFSRYYNNFAGLDTSTPGRGFRIIKLIKK